MPRGFLLHNLVCAVLTAVLFMAAGCAPDAAQTNGGATSISEDAGPEVLRVWPFWPTHMRIHPASRLVMEQDTGQAFIEARIEFTDSVGDTSKAIGVIKFDLLVAGLPANLSNPVLSWELPLNSMDDNALHYDGVTRTYLFRLSMGEWSTSPDVTLIATFESIDGKRFDDSQRFR